MGQIIAGLVITLVLITVTFFLLKRRQGERPDLDNYNMVTLQTLLKIVKDEMADITREGDRFAASDPMYEVISRNKRRLSDALRDSTYGIPAARDIVIATIKEIVQRELPTKEAVCEVVDFDDTSNMDPSIKWELLCVKLKPQYGSDIVGYLEKKYHISDKRVVNEARCPRYTREFDAAMLDVICRAELQEVLLQGKEVISYDEMTQTLATVLFSMYHGFGVVDTLLTLKVDGVNLGVSGSTRYRIEGRWDVPYRDVNAVWVMVGPYWVMFSFLDFHEVEEMRRVINQMVSWGTSAPMSEKKPYKVVDGYDGSRRTAIRPGAGESWAIFIRKFNLSVHSVKWLLDKKAVHNYELPMWTIYYLMKGQQTTGFTGQQGTGKTTIMAGAFEFIEDMNIRCLEMSFELALREVYPEKNTFTVKPTEYVSAANLQDLLKKTDGWVSSVGEVAEDIVAARMIQFGLIASAFTIFSHHGKDDVGLIDGLTNSLVACGEYKDHNVAASTVLDVIKHNVHLTKWNGERVVEYISQIVKAETLAPYPEIEKLLGEARDYLKEDKPDELAKVFIAYMSLTREYYTRRTDRVKFTSRYIVKFNKDTMTYEPGEWYTPEIEASIISNLSEEDRVGFKAFHDRYWGSAAGGGTL